MKGALVTGGTSGIGLGCARMLLEEGYAVAVCGRDEARLAAARRELGDVLALPCDVADRAAVQATIAATVERFGGLDVLVTSHGTFEGGWAHIDEVTPEDWQRTIDVNLTGTFNVLAAALPHLRERCGYAFTVSSIYGKHGMRRGAAYAASKWGILGLTSTLLQEVVEQGVRATAICPGLVKTPFLIDPNWRAEDLIAVQDVAEAVRWCLNLSPVTVVRELVLERLDVVRVDPERQEPGTPRST